MTKEEVVSLLDKAEWKFAKTFSHKAPHWYALREKWNNDEEFDFLVQWLRDNSVTRYFWRKPFQVFIYKGWRYWTMGAPINETILINKAFDMEQYNDIADVYDKLFEDDFSQKENEEIASMIPDNHKIYDIGSGTGLLLEIKQITKENYIGIDPSWLMNKKAKSKFEGYKFLTDRLETYQTNHHKTRDAICVSLFGSMNYVLPQYLKRIYELSDNYFLMFYKKDYSPITYEKAGKELFHNKYDKEQLLDYFKDSKITEWHNYYIVTNL